MGSGASSLPPEQRGYARMMATISSQTDPWQPAEVEGATTIQPQSVAPVSSAPKKTPIEESWLAVCESLDIPEGQKNPNTKLTVKRTGWKTIRIFVSSTFKDFHQERETLVKEIFPDLRVWCEERRLHLVECDLRWGVPKDTTTEQTLRTCLGEIDRCYQDNVMPYFLNMTSERIGWIPEPDEVPRNLVDEYRWIFGLSVTEMEIIHGAYRKDNPNCEYILEHTALFLIRDDSFLDRIPTTHKNVYLDENPIAVEKLQTLRQKIRDRFPETRVIPYKCEFESIDSHTNKARLTLDPVFRDKVMSFFKERISLQYPLLDEEEDPFQRTREAHESFMKSRSEQVLGRSNVLAKISEHITSGGSDTPLLILGGPGTGKSSIMSKAADEIVTKAFDNKIPGSGSKNGWHVFYHFVGAVPGSTDIRTTLIRLMRETGVVDDSNMPSDLESTVQLACSALNNPHTPPVIVFIDALNQFDEDTAATNMAWLPRKLSPRVRCVFSMIQDTPQHKQLMSRESKSTEVIVSPLSLAIRKDMVAEFLGKFNKRLDMDQMILLLSKKSSENPLWLSIACEELRVSGQFRTLDDMIDKLADGLLELLQQVLERFETEGGGSLLVYTLCLLEISATGLLESELLTILANEDSLKPPVVGDEKGHKEKSEKEKPKFEGKLPAFKWAGVYRSLRPFLRPFGNSGEGRLDFYHRSLSKAVRKKYLKIEEDLTEDGTLTPIYRWWHSKLADYFEQSDNYDRKVEEYPYHLMKLKDYKRLQRFIVEWPAFDRLYDKEHSAHLLKYWRECGGKDSVLEYYSEELQALQREGSGLSQDLLCERFVQVGRFLVQQGEYTYSEDLAKRVLEIEQESLGNRPEKIVELYSLLANIYDQKTKLHEFCGPEQVPEQTQCISYNQMCVGLLEGMSGTYYKHMLGLQYIKLAFSMASLADCGGSQDMPADKAISEGELIIEKAIKGFKERMDNGNLAEALMTKGVLSRKNTQTQIKLYEEALELCTQTYGRYHRLTGRINFNSAICYEDMRNYNKAYDLFKENCIINKEVFGTDHIKYIRSRELFNEPTYKRLHDRRNDDFF